MLIHESTMLSTYIFVFLFSAALGVRYGGWTMVAFSAFVLAVLFALHSLVVAVIGLVLFQCGFLVGAVIEYALSTRRSEAPEEVRPSADVVLLSSVRRQPDDPGA
jgi:hypothetical protein